jgi:cyclic pyranopterin phosphate synthase
MKSDTLQLIKQGKVEKGDVLGVARVAGIMAAKKTPELIPMCHPLNVTSVTIDFVIDNKKNKVDIMATTKVTGQTGVEMEALTATSVAALTIYDMCKAIDKEMIISEIMLLRKSGGKSGTFKRAGTGKK